MKQIFRDQSVFKYSNVFLFLIVIVTILLYLPSISGPFISDDYIYVFNNDQLQAMTFLDSWKLFFTRTNEYEYLPIRDLSYLTDLRLFGLNSTGFHMHNLLIYAATCIVVWFFSLSLFSLFREDGDSWYGVRFAAIVTTLFAVHPAHVESVAWISGRKDLLSGFFCMLALWRFSSALNVGSGRQWRLGIAYLFFLLGLLSKSTIVPLPIIAFIIGYVKYSEKPFDLKGCWQSTIIIWPFFMLSCVSVLIQVLVGRTTGILANIEALPNSNSYSLLSLSNRILGYLTHIAVLPFRLRLIYDIWAPGWRNIAAVVCGALAIIFFLIALYKLCRVRSLAAFGVATFIVFCLPFLQLIKFNTWSLASERFLYMPVLGLAVLLASVLANYRTGYTIILPLLLAAGSYLTFDRAITWRNETELSISNVKYSPENFNVVNNYVNSMLKENRYNEVYEHVLQIKDLGKREYLMTFIKVHKAVASGTDIERRNLMNELIKSGTEYEAYKDGQFLLKCGELYELCGDYLQAARCYHLAIQYRNQNTPPTLLSGIVKHYEPLLAELKDKIKNNPSDVAARMQLAGFYLKLFQIDKAEQQYRLLLSDFKAPEVVKIAHYNLGLTLLKKKDHKQARTEIEEAIKSGFNDAEAWNNLGSINRKLGNFDESEKCFRTAMGIDVRHKHSAFNLALLQQSRNKKNEAIESFKEARRRYVADGASTAMIDEQLASLEDKR